MDILKGPELFLISWSNNPKIARLSDTSNIPQHLSLSTAYQCDVIDGHRGTP